MKNISAVNVTHYERRVQATRQYFSTIEEGFQIFLQTSPLDILEKIETQNRNNHQKGFAAVIIGSEKGLCGEFNEKLIHFFHRQVAPKGEVTLIAIGHKIAQRLENYPMRTYEFPSTHEEISDLLRELLVTMNLWLKEKKIGEINFYYHHLISGMHYEPKTDQIFPLNIDWLTSLKQKPWDSVSLPVYKMDTETLFYELTQELLYISMYRAFIESLASENASRLRSMEAAEKNIDTQMADLQKNYQRQRQAEITDELADILAGFEALKELQ